MKLRLFFQFACLFLLSFWIVIMTLPSHAQTPPTWQTPPPPINRILDAPLPPGVTISPNRRWFVAVERPPLIPIAELAEPELKLAGLRLNSQTNAPADHYTFRRLTFRDLQGGEVQEVALPQDARLGFFRWSPEGDRLAFTIAQDAGLELWVLDLPSGKVRRLTDPILNATYGNPCRWLPGDEGLLCTIVPAGRGAPPNLPVVASGPSVEENLGRKAPARTYTNLLQTPHDEALFEYYLTSDVERISLAGERDRLVTGEIVDEATPSPDGNFILLETFHRPFSYQVPISRFPKKIEVLDLTGKKIYEVADLPLADNIPISFGSTRSGRRRVNWRSDRAATLYWVEALDGGDAGREATQRDVLFELAAPFTARPQELWRSQYRFESVLWGRDNAALIGEWWYDNRLQRLWQIDPQNPAAEAKLLIERNYQDQYSNPGTPLTTLGQYGRRVLRFTPDGNSIYFEGRGASAAGVYPFLDRFSLATGEKERLWQAQDPYYEQIEEVLDDEGDRLVTRRQSKQDPPNYFLVSRRGDAQPIPLTTYSDPAPEFAEVRKEIIQYERADGVQLSATLYLPPGYDPQRDGPRPAIFWVYPQEFKDVATASQITTAANTFSRPSSFSPLFLLLQGYVVVNNPKLPIIGEGDREPNDTYIEQLILGAKAAVAEVVDRGVADRDRLVIGGHSYGAFTTANLLAHSDLFQAGIAMSGAYNRSLTPFGFQGEQRSFWDAKDTYIQMSPFTHADKINEPLLLIHGAEDSNIGTYPIQSERLYEAIKGLGGTVRWVRLPHEGHGYRGKESIGHVLWEMIRWCDLHT